MRSVGIAGSISGSTCRVVVFRTPESDREFGRELGRAGRAKRVDRADRVAPTDRVASPTPAASTRLPVRRGRRVGPAPGLDFLLILHTLARML